MPPSHFNVGEFSVLAGGIDHTKDVQKARKKGREKVWTH